MFGIGSSMSFKDFGYVFKNLKVLITGLSLQMIFLPTFAFFIAIFSNLSPELKVGLFIISICPGGATSNFISYLVNANTALSVALTSINSLLILITIPFLSQKSIFYFTENSKIVNLPIEDTFNQIFIIIIIPGLSGMIFNKYCKKSAFSLKKPLKVTNILLLATVFAIKFFAGTESGGSGITKNEILQLLPFCLLLHIGAILISYIFSRKIIKLSNTDSTTIGIEVGLQNTTLTLLVTGTIINNIEMTKPALVFAIFSFFTTLLFALITIPKKL